MSGKAAKTIKPLRLRAKVWVESENGKALLSEPGADLLEQIEVCGSLSEAARRLGFAYRRAWMLVDVMNRGFGKQVVTATTGGKRGGGARLTELGKAVLAAYRDVQLHVEHGVDQVAGTFAAAIHQK